MKDNNILGNKEEREYLNEQVKKKNILHSYLFTGIEAIGKKMIS